MVLRLSAKETFSHFFFLFPDLRYPFFLLYLSFFIPQIIWLFIELDKYSDSKWNCRCSRSCRNRCYRRTRRLRCYQRTRRYRRTCRLWFLRLFAFVLVFTTTLTAVIHTNIDNCLPAFTTYVFFYFRHFLLLR